MKFTKLRQLALAAFAVCGLALGGQLTAHASDSAPDKVTMKLHKLDNQTPQTIQNTGDEVPLLEGMTPYNASTFGDIAYSVYDLTDLLEEEGVISGQTDSATFEKKRDQLIAKITGEKTDPEEILKAQAAFVAAHNLVPVSEEKLTDNSGLLTFSKLKNKGFYLIMETEAKTEYLTGLSAPMIIGLPLGDKDTIHLYPKNVVARDVDPEIHKVGINPEAPTSEQHVALEGIKFELKRADGEGKTIPLETDKNGDITFGNLVAGKEYVLTETSIAAYPWYNQDNVNDGKISLTFTVDKNGNVDPKIMKPSADYFKIDGTRIGILNYLILGGAKFEKVDAQNKKKVLAGAKFKVQKADHTGKISWAVFQDNNFVKWVTDKADATELTSGKDGTFDFTGVPYVYDQRDGKATYNLIETQAPAGYALLKEATEFEINEKTGIVTIENERYALPITGGMGIWLFLLIGSLLMGGAGYLYYRQRQQEN